MNGMDEAIAWYVLDVAARSLPAPWVPPLPAMPALGEFLEAMHDLRRSLLNGLGGTPHVFRGDPEGER